MVRLQIRLYSLIIFIGLSLLVGCSRYRYDYQDVVAEPQTVRLQQSAAMRFGDRYRIPDPSGFTHQAPFTPTLIDNLVVPRPVPMHNRPIEETTNLLDYSIEDKAFAEMMPDSRARMSLRIDVPGELAERALVDQLREQGADFTSDTAADVRLRTDCAYVYQVKDPADTVICIYTTLRSSYVVSVPDDEEDQQAEEFGTRLLQTLMLRFS